MVNAGCHGELGASLGIGLLSSVCDEVGPSHLLRPITGGLSSRLQQPAPAHDVPPRNPLPGHLKISNGQVGGMLLMCDAVKLFKECVVPTSTILSVFLVLVIFQPCQVQSVMDCLQSYSHN